VTVSQLTELSTLDCNSRPSSHDCPLTGSHWPSEAEPESELLYDWWFTANLFVLAPSLLRLTTRVFFCNWKLNPCGHCPCVTSSLTRRWACVLSICLAFVKSTYSTYGMLLKILPFTIYRPTSALSVQCLKCILCPSYLALSKQASSSLLLAFGSMVILGVEPVGTRGHIFVLIYNPYAIRRWASSSVMLSTATVWERRGKKYLTDNTKSTHDTCKTKKTLLQGKHESTIHH
jgi:hypothetical protein